MSFLILRKHISKYEMQTKRKMRKRFNKYLKTILIGILAIATIYILLPQYLQKALIYQLPGISDYKIFDNRKVSTGIPQPWPQATNYNGFPLSGAYADTLQHFNTIAFLVIQHDSILFETYNDGFSATSLSNSFSMAKSIVGLLTGCAIADGFIHSLDDKVQHYLPGIEGPYAGELTIRHLLTMRSGSSWDESYSSPFSLTTQAYYGRDLIKTFRKVKIMEQPGGHFSYKSGDTQLLARILARATGKSLAKYASEKLWQPLGAEQEALWSLDHPGGEEKAYCCFNSNARDFARLGALVLHNGWWKDRQLVPADYIKESIASGTQNPGKVTNGADYYGLHWWLMHHKRMEIPYARGILGQYIFVLPACDAVIVRLGHERSKKKRGQHPLDAYTWVDLGVKILTQNQ